jgi:hypothetical protein
MPLKPWYLPCTKQAKHRGLIKKGQILQYCCDITAKRCQSEVRISFASECAGAALLARVAGRMGVGQNGKKCICSYIRARAKAPFTTE